MADDSERLGVDDAERNRQFRVKAIDALASLGTAMVAQSNLAHAGSTWGEDGATKALEEYRKAMDDFIDALRELVDDEKRS